MSNIINAQENYSQQKYLSTRILLYSQKYITMQLQYVIIRKNRLYKNFPQKRFQPPKKNVLGQLCSMLLSGRIVYTRIFRKNDSNHPKKMFQDNCVAKSTKKFIRYIQTLQYMQNYTLHEIIPRQQHGYRTCSVKPLSLQGIYGYNVLIFRKTYELLQKMPCQNRAVICYKGIFPSEIEKNLLQMVKNPLQLGEISCKQQFSNLQRNFFCNPLYLGIFSLVFKETFSSYNQIFPILKDFQQKSIIS
eukprot:TRINITY_DN29515_c0_g1_i9.p2 TRINITY_DN29515_c0_g1~~TRINITY_DN29515_c0_g1_i9.p2  ORF type:complete len:246 (+),score=-7.46 TRINITY_DN29515_c0_g1_i9:734-1471(+)